MTEFDRAPILHGKYDAVYHQCPACGLVATRDTPWLEEAYTNAIHDADAGILRRARRVAWLTASVIRFEGLRGGRFLDWAGGYGVLTQTMRERGYDFWHHDDFASPVFAREFQDHGEESYDLISAFEVIEHLADPRRELAGVTARSDYLLFTTETLPDPAPTVDSWWYYMPEVGQHITFHTVESLRILGRHLGYELTSNGANWHLFHRNPVSLRTRALLSPHTTASARKARAAVQRLRP
jgi:hypothetical protein